MASVFSLLFQLSIFEMTNFHQYSKVDCFSFSLCLVNDLFFAPDFRQLPCRQFLELFPSFVHRGFSLPVFLLLGQDL